MARKTFAFYRTTPAEPVEFDLNGHTIHCASSIDGLTLLKFAAATGEDNEGAAAKASLDFLKTAILPIDWPTFEQVAQDPATVFGPDQMGEIAEWLAEQYSTFPTSSPATSSAGSLPSGSGSVVAPSYPELATQPT